MADLLIEDINYQTLIDKVITDLADKLTVKKRFDIGCGYSQDIYNEIKILNRVLDTTDEDIELESLQNRIKRLHLDE